MSGNLEWDVAQLLITPYADIPLNQPVAQPDGSAWLYQVMIDGYQVVPAKFRPTEDSLSQADGSSIQHPYVDGLVATLDVAYYELPRDGAERRPACAETLRAMDELLMGALNSLRALPADVLTQQYRWRPSGASFDRVLNGVMLAAWPAPDFSHGPPEVRSLVQVGSPYPYAADDNPLTTSIAAGASGVVTNAGNADESIVVRAHGASSGFSILDVASGRQVVYDAGRPGAVAIAGGHYAEIDFFAGSILLDGIPDEAHNLIAGLDPTATDLFPLRPGAHTIAAVGASIDVGHSNAWV